MALLFATAAMLAQITAQGPYQMNESDVSACGALAVSRNEHRAELTRRDAAVNARTAELRAKQAQTESMRATVNLKNKKAVEEFNQQIAAVNALRAAIEPEIAARDRYTDETNQLITSFNTKCANKNFNPTDMALLPPEQRAALTEKATTRTVRVPAAPKQRR